MMSILRTHFQLAHSLLLMESEKGLGITEQLLPKSKEGHGIDSHLYIEILCMHALLLQEQGYPDQALPFMEEAHEFYLNDSGECSEPVLKSHINIAACYGDLSNWEKCKEHFTHIFQLYSMIQR